MAKVFDRVKMASNTAGVANLTLVSAFPGFRSFLDAGAVDGDTVSYVIEDGNNWEVGYGQLGGSGSILSRNVIASSAGGTTKINLSGTNTIQVYNGLTKAELDAKADVGHTHTFASLTSKPTTLAGYGITDAAASGHTHTFTSLTSKPTTLAGYGITDAAASGHTHTFTSLTSKPTTLAGYGITDALLAANFTFANLGGKPTTLAGYGITDAAASGHTHTLADMLTWGVHSYYADVRDKFAYIGSDGVMEVGGFIDFHDADNDGTDFKCRLGLDGTGGFSMSANALSVGGTKVSLVGHNHDGVYGKVSTSNTWDGVQSFLGETQIGPTGGAALRLTTSGDVGYIQARSSSGGPGYIHFAQMYSGSDKLTEVKFFATNVVMTDNLTANNNLTVFGTSYIRGTSPTQWWQDSDNRAFGIHVNGDTAYFMRGGINDPNWSTLANGQWPMTMNLNTGAVTMGNDLNVVGNVTVTYNLNAKDIYASRGDGTGVIFLGNTGRYLYWDGSNYILQSGSLVVGGNITASSDIRFKSDIRPLDDHERIFEGLRSYRYFRDGREQIGFIAQYVEKELPEAVLTDSSAEAYKSVDLYPIVATLVEQVRELKARVAELEAQ